MGEAYSNSTSALRPLSQLNFKLSQRLPASQRAVRRQFSSRADSIEDDSPEDCIIADALIEEYDSSGPGGKGVRGISVNSSITGSDTRGEAHQVLYLNSPQTLSSPILSLGSAASPFLSLESTASLSHKLTTMQSTQHTRRTTPLPMATCLDVQNAARVPLSKIPSNSRQRDESLPSATGAHTPRRTPVRIQRQHLCAQSSLQSPMRTITSLRQNIGPQTPPIGRPLLSQKPCMPRLAGLHNPTPSSQPEEQTPTKRPRRMGAAATEFEQVVSQEVSGFCIWSHCLGSESSAQLVCHRPQACIQLQLHSAKRVLDPHLFSAYAHIAEVRTEEGGQLLASGQPIRVLLSLSLCLDAMPQAAERMARKLLALDEDEDAEPIIVAVYRPWRIQGMGEQQCLLTSRFQLG